MKKQIRRFFSLILAVCCLLSITACIAVPVGGYNSTASNSSSSDNKPNKATIILDAELPTTINYYTYAGKLQSSCSITEVSFEVWSGDNLYIYFSGKKTYDSRGDGQSDSCKIGYKLYDDENNVIYSGTVYTPSLTVGEGFIKKRESIYDRLVAGKTYKLVLLNVN